MTCLFLIVTINLGQSLITRKNLSLSGNIGNQRPDPSKKLLQKATPVQQVNTVTQSPVISPKLQVNTNTQATPTPVPLQTQFAKPQIPFVLTKPAKKSTKKIVIPASNSTIKKGMYDNKLSVDDNLEVNQVRHYMHKAQYIVRYKEN